MNENENNFESLRQLLALKRREIPPHGYFDNFSSQIIARIRSGVDEKPARASKQLSSEASWLLKLLRIFEAKPAFAVGFASTLCLLLLLGTIFAGQPESAPQPLLQTSAQPTTPFVASLSPADLTPSANQTGIIASTNPMFELQPVASLFGDQNPLAQQVSFNVPGN
jgi:hypothetical protein